MYSSMLIYEALEYLVDHAIRRVVMFHCECDVPVGLDHHHSR